MSRNYRVRRYKTLVRETHKLQTARKLYTHAQAFNAGTGNLLTLRCRLAEQYERVIKARARYLEAGGTKDVIMDVLGPARIIELHLEGMDFD